MRDVNAAGIAALETDSVSLAILGEFEFLSATQNLWAGPEGHVLDYDSKQWYSLGDIGQIDKISEGQGLADSRSVVSLHLNSEMIDVVDVEDSRGRAATITLLILSDQGEIIAAINFRNTMGKTAIHAAASTDEDGQTVVNERLSLELLNETASYNQSHYNRMTYEGGLRIDSDDHGLEFVSDPEAINIGLATTSGPRDREWWDPRRDR